MVLVPWPEWSPCPYIVKLLNKNCSLEPKGQMNLGLRSIIWDVGPLQLGLLLPTYDKVKELRALRRYFDPPPPAYEAKNKSGFSQICSY